jgi:putative transposase
MKTPTRAAYTTDLTDAQWERIKPLIPPPKPGGRPASVSRREIVNAIVYLARNGCTWRDLPHDFPAWKTVYHSFRLWRDDGSWQQIHDALVVQVRVVAGRDPSPSVAILDSQSVKTTEKRGSSGALTVGNWSKAANDMSGRTR